MCSPEAAGNGGTRRRRRRGGFFSLRWLAVQTSRAPLAPVLLELVAECPRGLAEQPVAERVRLVLRGARPGTCAPLGYGADASVEGRRAAQDPEEASGDLRILNVMVTIVGPHPTTIARKRECRPMNTPIGRTILGAR